ncbi:hypothetical protein P9314_00770 [Paenibacillus validus]|nr:MULTISPECIES: hypothetical protein [Paenibacillus]MED4599243.1 hypothetical protein [Paenibacillus validus]MED4606450.1 hypothetical protein [Paenibacillus validus]
MIKLEHILKVLADDKDMKKMFNDMSKLEKDIDKLFKSMENLQKSNKL